MAHKVIVPPKKNYIPQFLKQRDINSYSVRESEFLIRIRSDLVLLDSHTDAIKNGKKNTLFHTFILFVQKAKIFTVPDIAR